MSAERYELGARMLTAVDGPAGLEVVEELAKSFPDFARYVLEFPFGDIYAREGLGLRERELATVAALCALGHARPQLRVHVHAALHVGCKPAEVVEIVMQMAEERAPKGFTSIEEIIPRHELETIARDFKIAAGFDPESLNRRPSLSVAGSRV